MSNNNTTEWFKLDVSAKIYPSLESVRNPAVFRISMQMYDKVDEKILLQALEKMKSRFPYYQVQLRMGLFWYYIERNDRKMIVWPDTPSPCERLNPTFNNGFLYRVKYYKNNIALECFHVLTDGYGGLEFLKCLVHQYLLLTNKVSGKSKGIIDIGEDPQDEEFKDAFLSAQEKIKEAASAKTKRTLFGSGKVFKIKDKLLPLGINKVITGILSIVELKDVSKKYDATVTQLLVSLYIEALIQLQVRQERNLKKHKDIAIQVPVNMRKYYPYRCMRNFSLFIIPRVSPSKIENFYDIVKNVKAFMQEHLTIEHLNTMIKDNCELATNKLIQCVPLGLKNLVVKYINNTMGSSQFTGTISNLGLVRLPDEMSVHVKNVSFVVGTSHNDKCTCGVMGYNDCINISFSRNIKDTYIERHVFRRLVELGVKVTLKSN